MAGSEKKTIAQEFAEFINRGNVMDLAVGVIIGGAFTAVVNALVENIVQPFISFITGGEPGVPGLSIDLNGSVVDFSAFISAIINFLIVALCVFLIVKGLNKLNAAKELAEKKIGKAHDEEAAPEPRSCPYCKQEIADEATRCPHCTAKLEGYANPAE